MRGIKKLKLTTRGRYAVLAMVELAQNKNKDPVPLVELAQKGDISLSYLEQLFAGLRKHGLVKSYRGPGGGYVLARPATDIWIADILESAEDCVPAKRGRKGQASEDAGNGQTALLWDHIGEILYLVTRNISLHDVIRGEIGSLSVVNKLFETAA